MPAERRRSTRGEYYLKTRGTRSDPLARAAVDYHESFDDLEVTRGRLRLSRSGVKTQSETAEEQEQFPDAPARMQPSNCGKEPC
eukprot:12310000-Heterocapsa_arctica.AAC.1